MRLFLLCLLPLFASAVKDPYTTMHGKRILVLGNFFLGDFDHKPTEHHEAVEGQLCEFAARNGVTVDFMLWEQGSDNQASSVYALCHGTTVFCNNPEWRLDNTGSKDVLRCYQHNFGSREDGIVHSAVTSRDDEWIEAFQVLSEALKLPPPFKPGHQRRLQHSAWARSFMQHFDRNATYPIARDCQMPSPQAVPEEAFPLYIKYAQGLHSSGGWGGQCIRQLSYVQDRAHLAARLPFFCGAGMRSYEFLQTPTQRDIFLTSHLFGIEISTEIAVFRGKIVFAAFRAGHMTCDGELLHTWPASAPGWEAAEPSCRKLVERVITAAGVWNTLAGVQLMYDWREGSPTHGCRLVELNPRPHDWAMLGNHGWGIRHGGNDYFDYGAAALYLAFDIDPTPLRLERPPEYASAVALKCSSHGEHEYFGTGGIFTYAQFMRAVMREPNCDVKIAPTSSQAREALRGGWPCLEGPKMLPLGPKLEKLCLEEIGQDGVSFWWIDSEQMKSDVIEVCRSSRKLLDGEL